MTNSLVFQNVFNNSGILTLAGSRLKDLGPQCLSEYVNKDLLTAIGRPSFLFVIQICCFIIEVIIPYIVTFNRNITYEL